MLFGIQQNIIVHRFNPNNITKESSTLMLGRTETFHYLPVDHLTQIKVDFVSGARALVAQKPILQGSILYSFFPWITVTTPSYLSIQIGIDNHIYLKPDHLQFVNHSCSPNAFFDTVNMEFVALKKIDQYEEITFFYPSTEWQMAQPFQCACGSIECLKTIAGAMYLNEEQYKTYKLNKHILEQFQLSKSISVAS